MPERHTQDRPEPQKPGRQGPGKQTGTPGRTGGDSSKSGTIPESGRPEKTIPQEGRE